MSSEALVVVVDVGPSLVGSAGHVRAVEALEAARRVLRARLQAQRARDTVGVVLYGTHETRHALPDAGTETDAARGVFAAYDLGPPCAAVLRFLAPRWALPAALAAALPASADAARLPLAACGAPHGTLVGALTVALDMLARRSGTRTAPVRRIFVVSDLCGGDGANSPDIFDRVVAQLQSSGARLNVIDLGADGDDEAQSPARAANLALLARVTAALGEGAVAVVPGHAARELLSARAQRTAQPRSCYRCVFEITPDLRISVHAYIKSREQLFPTLKKISDSNESDGADEGKGKGEDEDNNQDNNQDPDRVVMARSLHAADDPAGAEVARADAVRAYRYGRTLVPFGAADEAALRAAQAGERGLTLLGFTRAAHVPRHHAMGGVDALVAAPSDRAAQRAFAALVAAMAQTASCAVCRLVAQRNAAPALVALVPRPRPRAACCACWVLPLPFAEDLRYYQFAPLLPSDRRARRDTAPTPAQREAARNLVASMSLVLPKSDVDNGGGDGDGPDGENKDKKDDDDSEEEIEFLAPKRTFNPILRRFFDTVDAKTVAPGGVHVATPTACAELGVPEPVRKRARAALDAFSRAFPLEPVAPDPADTKQFWRSKLLAATSAASSSSGPVVPSAATAATSPSGGKTVVVVTGSTAECCGTSAFSSDGNGNGEDGKFSLDALVASRTEAVGTVQPARDFAAMLARRDADLVRPAVAQLCARIRQFVRDSLGGQYFAKALDALVALRRGCVAEDEPALFNDFLLELRQHCSGGGEGADDASESTSGGVSEGARFWAMVAEARVVPVSSAESVFSSVPPDEAAHFHAPPEPAPASFIPLPVDTHAQHDDALDDLFNMAD